MSQPIHYPLIFTYKDAVSGNGFLAGVQITGRALITKEDDQWCMYGVTPAGIAETGSTPNETFKSFRERYRVVLYDIAAEVSSFDAFHAEVSSFFYEGDPSEEEIWTEAHRLLKSGEVTLEEPFSKLKKEAPEGCPVKIMVIRLDTQAHQTFTPNDNVPDIYLMPVAAAA